MKPSYFISDVHLGLQEPEIERQKERALLSFLEHVQSNAGRLYILGDLFDFWFEYRHVIPKGYHRVLGRLSDLTESGVEVHYLAGNHDFWVRSYFHEALGLTVHRDPFAEELGGKRFFYHHGDGLAIRDNGYRILKKVFRSKVSIFLFSLLHPDLGIGLARSWSRMSREHTSTKNYGEGDGMVEYAVARIKEGFDYVVMGHRHEPASRKVGGGTYINLGDWITHRTYGVFDGDDFRLEQWN